MMQKWLLSILFLGLTACGKSGAERYLGYWQDQDDKRILVFEIKQENGNYFLIENILAQGNSAGKQMVLSEKDGELTINYGVGNMPLKLSDDGKIIFIKKKSFQKIDVATKDKIMAHEERCRQLTKAFYEASKALPSMVNYKEYKIAKDALKQKYFPQFEQLEREMRCNKLPLDYKENGQW